MTIHARGAARPRRPGHLLALAAYAALLVLLVQRAADVVPDVQPEDAPAQLFSEARALKHVRVLAVDIGMRRLSTPGLQRARRYLQQAAAELARLAADTRPDLVVEVGRRPLQRPPRTDQPPPGFFRLLSASPPARCRRAWRRSAAP
jgi:hypothetical protein